VRMMRIVHYYCYPQEGARNEKVVLFPLTLRKVEFRNRIFVSPMCQYSCKDGMPNDWHLVHSGQQGGRGAALVLSEATAVAPEAESRHAILVFGTIAG